jgi:hypothetical protein
VHQLSSVNKLLKNELAELRHQSAVSIHKKHVSYSGVQPYYHQSTGHENSTAKPQGGGNGNDKEQHHHHAPSPMANTKRKLVIPEMSAPFRKLKDELGVVCAQWHNRNLVAITNP